MGVAAAALSLHALVTYHRWVGNHVGRVWATLRSESTKDALEVMNVVLTAMFAFEMFVVRTT